MAPKPESLPQLFDAVKAKFPESLGPDRWYLVAASSLITNSNPTNFAQLWTYLTAQGEYQALEKRQALNRRLREFLMKQWVTIGVPKSAVALFSLIKEEKPGDADLSFTKYVALFLSAPLRPLRLKVNYRPSHAALTPANRERGTQFLRYLYTEEQMEAMWKSWGKDSEWLTKEIVYGMFYGDDTVLGFVDTELITYTAIMCQGLQVTIHNHLGGLLGMGLSVEEIEGVTECGELVAKWSGVDTSGWPDVREIAAGLKK
ncbi:hypothetical protein HO173_000831 [Letharia columbiana]|uniref:Uncharacterized protein n=1 Tax=Letharia columbiana TaxID=112416 RepID=A0A8H6LA08_9LECA|nr:uncharacterized protein HO173_000831 [Letharia columbiana]KAF6241037.1 hypothetical protein HO173_000831 [Letharia columbiana]